MAIYTDLNSTAVNTIATDISSSGAFGGSCIRKIYDTIPSGTINLFDLGKRIDKSATTVSAPSMTWTNGIPKFSCKGYGYVYFYLDMSVLKPNTDYTFSWTRGFISGSSIGVYKNSTWIGQEVYSTSFTCTFNTGTLQDTDVIYIQAYLAGSSSTNTFSFTDVVLVEGTTAVSTYIPYVYPKLERYNEICVYEPTPVSNNGINYWTDSAGNIRVQGTSTAASEHIFNVTSFSGKNRVLGGVNAGTYSSGNNGGSNSNIEIDFLAVDQTSIIGANGAIGSRYSHYWSHSGQNGKYLNTIRIKVKSGKTVDFTISPYFAYYSYGPDSLISGSLIGYIAR